MRSIDRKLLRDLWKLKTQVLTIALVIASGIGGFIATFSTHTSLLHGRDHYYESARFPQIFATVKRAPQSLVRRIGEIPGVAEVDTRISRDTQLSIPGVVPPMIGRLIGLDLAHPPRMNRITLRSGRWPTPGVRNEAVVNHRFFVARSLQLGQDVFVLMNGKRERLSVVGTALSPEYIYATRGGGMPDDEWFGVFWLDAAQLAAAYDMESAFNKLLLRLERGASEPGVIAELDRLLARYGSIGAVGRDEQPSHKILTQEIDQQQVMGTILPSVFLLVAAFILNVVLHRQVAAQRGEIAALKALGYDDRVIAWHYLKFTSVVVLIGTAMGIALGAWLGRGLTALYTDFFQFPEFDFRVSIGIILLGALIALAAAFGGALAAIRNVVRLHPAEALRPPAPAEFRPLLVERLGFAHLLSPAQRMILRNLERRPVRAAMAVAGVAGSIAILISGTFWSDAIDHIIEVQFGLVQRGDVTVGFFEPLDQSVRWELERLPGVLEVELQRSAAVRLQAGNRSYRTGVNGLVDDNRLSRVIDMDLDEKHPAPDAALLTTRLAERLGVVPGDTLRMQFIDGKRRTVEVRVSGTADEMAGMNVWMRLTDLNRLAGDGQVVSTASLRTDPRHEDDLLERLKQVPGAAVVIVNRTLLETFENTNARNILFFTAVLTAFAATIAVGVVYNNARIQLAERAWELASLRVIGMTRREVSVLLLGELAIELVLAIPLGFVAGFWLSALVLSYMHPDVFEIPLVIMPTTYLYAGVAILLAGVFTALIVRHRIDHLDLVAVLKTRE